MSLDKYYLVFEGLESVHLTKDVGGYIKKLSDLKGKKANIIHRYKIESNESYKFIRINAANSLFFYLGAFLYFLRKKNIQFSCKVHRKERIVCP